MPFLLEDFRFDGERNEYICPNGKILAARGIPHQISPQGGDYLFQRYAAKKQDCDALFKRIASETKNGDNKEHGIDMKGHK